MGNITYYYVVGESIKNPNDSKWQEEKTTFPAYLLAQNVRWE